MNTFQTLTWRDVTCEILERHYEATSGFSPNAFCYFLPGIYSAGIREDRPDLLVNRGLINILDRGNAPGSWDDFSAHRWPRLTSRECIATQQWILRLSRFDPPEIPDDVLSRAYDTIDLLANQSAATPIASWPRS